MCNMHSLAWWQHKFSIVSPTHDLYCVINTLHHAQLFNNSTFGILHVDILSRHQPIYSFDHCYNQWYLFAIIPLSFATILLQNYVVIERFIAPISALLVLINIGRYGHHKIPSMVENPIYHAAQTLDVAKLKLLHEYGASLKGDILSWNEGWYQPIKLINPSICLLPEINETWAEGIC